MFERYTEKARRVIFFARYEASQFGSPNIETEHLLLGLLREDKVLTNRFLRSLAEVESIRQQVEKHTTVLEKVSTSVDLPLSNESKRALVYAGEEAERLSHKHMGTEHLLLGLLREEKSFAAQILMERGLELNQLREELARQPHDETQALRPPSVHDELGLYVGDLADKTQPLVGRDEEIDRLIELLCRFTRINAVLVGERGVGKKTIVGEVARRIANGDVPQTLAGKAILSLDLPPLRVLHIDGSWHERVDRALVTRAEKGKVFFVNRMHDRPGGISPVSWIHVTELLQRPIMAGKIQCIGTSTPASFARLKADGHWLAEYFEPVNVPPANEEAAIKVLHGIKAAYETFHNVSYTDDAIAHAVLCATKHIKSGGLPGTAVDLLDAAGAAAQVQKGLMPGEIVEVQKRLRFIALRMEASVANHEFEKARFYSQEERKERTRLDLLRKKYELVENPGVAIRREDIVRAVSKLTGSPDDSGSRSDS